MSTQVTRVKGGTAAVNDTIELNDVEVELEKARFDHQARLFALQQEFNAKRDKLRTEYDVEVEYRAFELHPGIPPEGQTIPFNPARMAAGRSNFALLADEAGLPHGERTHWYDSTPAHEAAEWATDLGAGEKFRWAVYQAYFVEDRNIGSPDVLCELAGQLGLDADDLRAALAEGRFDLLPRCLRLFRCRFWLLSADDRRLHVDLSLAISGGACAAVFQVANSVFKDGNRLQQVHIVPCARLGCGHHQFTRHQRRSRTVRRQRQTRFGQEGRNLG